MKICFLLFLTGAGYWIPAASLTLLSNPFSYASEYTDQESKLQYLNARYYSMHLARFVQRDSYDLVNRYAYADGNSIMYKDPSGHISAFIGPVLGLMGTLTGCMHLELDYLERRQVLALPTDFIIFPPIALGSASVALGILGYADIKEVSNREEGNVHDHSYYLASFILGVGSLVWPTITSVLRSAPSVTRVADNIFRSAMTRIRPI